MLFYSIINQARTQIIKKGDGNVKRPVLNRLMTIVLVVFGISMLIAGLLGLRSAGKERKQADAEIQQLKDLTEEYRTVTNQLIDEDDYSTINDTFTEQKEAYDKAVDQQRSDLAVYTATKGGLTSGSEAMDKADDALKQGKAQYNAGVAAFEEQEAQFLLLYETALAAKSELEEGKILLEEAASTLVSLRQASDGLRSLDTLMDLNADGSPESAEALYLASLAAYDTAIEAVSAAENAVYLITDREIPIQTVKQALEAAGISLAVPLDDTYVVIFPSAGVARLEEAAGISLAEIQANFEAGKAALIAGGTDSVLTPEQFETIRSTYTNNRIAAANASERIGTIVGELEVTVTEARAQLASAEAGYAQLETAKAALDQGRAALEEAGKQIVAGEKALEDGRSQLLVEQNKLDKKEAELEKERDRLEHEQEELASLEEKTEKLKNLEERESALRSSLLSREEIAFRKNNGVDVLRAAEEYADDYEKETLERYRKRFAACVLQILCCLSALMLIPLVFGSRDLSALHLITVLFCFSFAVAAQILFFRLGRGISYSAVLSAAAAAVMAFIHLIPARKKIGKGKHAPIG